MVQIQHGDGDGCGFEFDADAGMAQIGLHELRRMESQWMMLTKVKNLKVRSVS